VKSTEGERGSLQPWTNTLRFDQSTTMRAHLYADRFSIARVQTYGAQIHKSASVPAPLLSPSESPFRRRSIDCGSTARPFRSAISGVGTLMLAARERDLKVRGPVLLGVKAAPVRMPSAPEEQPVGDVHQVELLEDLPLDQVEGHEPLPKDVLFLAYLPSSGTGRMA
jgi:hypothetical protein